MRCRAQSHRKIRADTLPLVVFPKPLGCEVEIDDECVVQEIFLEIEFRLDEVFLLRKAAHFVLPEVSTFHA